MEITEALRARASALDAEADQKAPLRGPRAPQPEYSTPGWDSADGRDPEVLRLVAGEFRRLADQLDQAGDGA